MLIIARFAQGLGGAFTSAVILGMIVTMFPEPREQAKAIGVYAFVASAGGAVGLIAGGVITQWVSWHWIFFVNVPIGIAAVLVSRRLLPADTPPQRRDGADVLGAILVTAALMLGVYSIVEPAAKYGWLDPVTLLTGAVALVLLAGFVVRESVAEFPLMRLGILRSRNVAGSNIIQVVGAAGMFGSFFLGALYLQKVLGYDPLEIGLAFLPVTVLMGVISVRYSERLVSRFGARRTMIPGLVMMCVGLGLFALAPADASYVVNIVPVMVLLGVGGGICFPPLMNLAMSGSSPEDAGLASGLINTTGQVGGALGLAVLATVSSSRTTTLRGRGISEASALTGGYHAAYWIAAALTGLSVVVGLLVLRDAEAGEYVPEDAAELDDDLDLDDAVTVTDQG
jgi:EmrB/QacA subfamily drug resistance transporter